MPTEKTPARTVGDMRPGESFSIWHGYVHADSQGTILVDLKAEPESGLNLAVVECVRDGRGKAYDITLEKGDTLQRSDTWHARPGSRVEVRNLYQYVHSLHGSHGRRVLLSGPGPEVGVA